MIQRFNIILFLSGTTPSQLLEIMNSNSGSAIPVAARSKAWVYGRPLAGIVGSNPTGGMDVCLL